MTFENLLSDEINREPFLKTNFYLSNTCIEMYRINLDNMLR